jgi:hypothetical protein
MEAPMKHATRTLAIAATVMILVLTAPPAEAVSDDALSLAVLVNGEPLHEIAARGTTYIQAVRHAEYALRLTNRTGRRMAVALAVDGLNTIDAKTGSASRASKWVIGPWQTVTIEGWQIGPDAARRFFFTSEDKSYGAWLGTTANLGVIEAVAFLERIPEPPQRVLENQRRESSGLGSSDAAAPRAAGKQRPDEGLDDEIAATGIGRRIDHRVRRVRLDLERSPAAQLRVRYEYREQLVHLGVLPSHEEERALARRERASGFDRVDFAPDPWGGK